MQPVRRLTGLIPILLSAPTPRHTGMPMSSPSISQKRTIRGLVFDMDGTLTIPNLDFKEMYRRCGVDMSKDLLTEVAKMDPAVRERAEAAIEEIEEEGRRTMQLMPGALELAKWIKEKGIPAAVVSRNTVQSAEVLSSRLWAPLLSGVPPLSPLIGRDTQPLLAPKPDPAALIHIASLWGVAPSELIMVGDSVANDIVSGSRAGAATALLDSGRRFAETQAGKPTDGVTPDIVVHTLCQLPVILSENFDIVPAVM